MKVGPSELKAVREAVRAQFSRPRKNLLDSDRGDVYQDLVIELLKCSSPPEKLQGWLYVVAGNLVADLVADRERFSKALAEMSKLPPYVRDCAIWEPSWYPPHAEATEYPPFACEGARLMHVKGDRFGRSSG